MAYVRDLSPSPAPGLTAETLKSHLRVMARGSEGAVFMKDHARHGARRAVCVIVTRDRHFLSAVTGDGHWHLALVRGRALGSRQDGRADRGLSCGSLTCS